MQVVPASGSQPIAHGSQLRPMFLAHSFRLRDPWQCDCLTNGTTRWSRVFHRPTGLEPDDALWLVCSGLPAEATVTLNGKELSRDATSGQAPSS